MFKHVVSAALLFVALARAEPVYLDDYSIKTRFGVLRIDDEHVLLHDGRPLNPQIAGNNSLDIVDVYEIGDVDVVLVEDVGGSACPIQLYLVTLSATGATSIGPFGTCSEILHARRRGDAIWVVMYGFVGPLAPEADQRLAARKHVFVFKNGVLTEDGQKVR